MTLLGTALFDLALVVIIVAGIMNEERLIEAEDELWAVIKWAAKHPNKVLKNIERSVFG